MVREHLMKLHFLLDFLLEIHFFAVLHLHLLLLLVQYFNEPFPLHCVKQIIELFRSLVPYPEGVVNIWLSKVVFDEFGGFSDFLSEKHVHLEVVPGPGRSRIAIH